MSVLGLPKEDAEGIRRFGFPQRGMEYAFQNSEFSYKQISARIFGGQAL